MDQHHTHRLVAALHQERQATVGRTVPDEIRLELEDVGSVDPQHVAQVLVVRADLQHVEGLLVMSGAHQRPDVPEVDQAESDVHRDHRPDLERGVERGEHHAGEEVEDTEAQNSCLHHREDQQRRPAPADQVQPGHPVRLDG